MQGNGPIELGAHGGAQAGLYSNHLDRLEEHLRGPVVDSFAKIELNARVS